MIWRGSFGINKITGTFGAGWDTYVKVVGPRHLWNCLGDAALVFALALCQMQDEVEGDQEVACLSLYFFEP